MNNTRNGFIVEMTGIVKNFPGVRALSNVDFSLKPGEIRGLVGKNGAGKSTLINVLTGIYNLDAGEIGFEGKPVPQMTSTVASELGITCVHQHSQLIAPLSIAENIFCGKMPVNRFGIVDWQRLNREAEIRLQRLGLRTDVTRKVEGLSVAERQILEIAKALFADAKVIVLDEATAPLPKSEVEMLFNFVRRQRELGVAFIYISHYLEEVFKLCDTVTVLRDGEKVGDYNVQDLDQQELIRLISGRKVEKFQRIARELNGKTVLQVQGLTLPRVYQDLNLDLKAGEIIGLTGLEGCGKDVFARGLFGLDPIGQGTIKVEGKPFTAVSPRKSLAQGVAYLPRDRHGYGIIGLRPINENITLPILRKLITNLGLLKNKDETSLVTQMMEKLKIKASSINQPVQFLSGGNQQKVVFAKLVSAKPKVLLLDEPTQGVDVQAKVEIMRIVDQLVQDGVAVIVISEEIRELLELCDRILVMYQGNIVQEFKNGEEGTTVEAILNAVEGGK
jgi:ABC-type sugar transport system ATPase subunit